MRTTGKRTSTNSRINCCKDVSSFSKYGLWTFTAAISLPPVSTVAMMKLRSSLITTSFDAKIGCFDKTPTPHHGSRALPVSCHTNAKFISNAVAISRSWLESATSCNPTMSGSTDRIALMTASRFRPHSELISYSLPCGLSRPNPIRILNDITVSGLHADTGDGGGSVLIFFITAPSERKNDAMQ